jgi:UDP:flavonoid glycosyltransferase YjiC (YdhE family)
MPKHILFAWELGARWGHLASILPVAHALKARGYRLTLAAQDPLLALSVADHPFDRVLAAPFQRATTSRPCITYADVIAPHGFDRVETCVALLTAWRMLFDLVAPDLIVIEHAPGALTAAALDGRALQSLGTGWSCPKLESPLPDLAPLRPATWAERTASETAVLDVINDAAQRLGAPAHASLAALFGKAPDFLMTWPELDHYGMRADGYYYGPIKSIGATARPDWPAGDGPRCFIYLPAKAKVLPGLVSALARLGWPCILHSAGPYEGPLPTTIAYSRKPVDVPWLLPQADIIINRGGHGLMVEAMRAGCVQFHWPDTFESRLCALRLAHHGAALVGPADPTPDALQLTLEQGWTSPRLKAASRAIAQRYGAFDEMAALDELVEDMLADAGWA